MIKRLKKLLDSVQFETRNYLMGYIEYDEWRTFAIQLEDVPIGTDAQKLVDYIVADQKSVGRRPVIIWEIKGSFAMSELREMAKPDTPLPHGSVLYVIDKRLLKRSYTGVRPPKKGRVRKKKSK